MWKLVFWIFILPSQASKCLLIILSLGLRWTVFWLLIVWLSTEPLQNALYQKIKVSESVRGSRVFSDLCNEPVFFWKYFGGEKSWEWKPGAKKLDNKGQNVASIVCNLSGWQQLIWALEEKERLLRCKRQNSVAHYFYDKRNSNINVALLKWLHLVFADHCVLQKCLMAVIKKGGGCMRRYQPIFVLLCSTHKRIQIKPHESFLGSSYSYHFFHPATYRIGVLYPISQL